jgi:hypothetical protein
MAYRDSYASSGFTRSLTPWVLRLLVVNTVVFVGTVFIHLFGVDVTRWLALDPAWVVRAPWTVVTYPFTHGLNVLMWLLDSLMIFFLGPRLEERWGGPGFLRFGAVAVLAAAAADLAVSALGHTSFPIFGSTVLVDGLFFAWALYWPTEEILFFGIIPIQIRWLFAGILAVSVLGYASMGPRGFLFLAPMAATLAGCYALLHSRWAPHSWGELPARRAAPRKPRPAPPSKAVAQWMGKKEAPSAPAPARPPVAAAGARRASRAEKELLDDVDRILDKISAQGLSALTEDERKRLDEVSRRYRTN